MAKNRIKKVNKKKDNIMLPTLINITATFLALWIAFILSYVVYLKTAEFNIDQSIAEIGSKLTSISSEFNYIQNPCLLIGQSLMSHYQEIYNQKTELEILNEISRDLLSNDENKAQMLRFFGNNDGLHYKGKVFLFLINEYMRQITNTTSLVEIGSFHVNKKYERTVKQKQELFPNGPLGVEGWLNTFKSVIDPYPYQFLGTYKNLFLEDYQKFLQETPDKKINKFDYDKYVEKINDTVALLKEEVKPLEGLLRLKKYQAIHERLPHLRLIIFLLAIIFLLGVLIPLFILGAYCNDIPKIINFMFLISVFASIAICIVLLLSDLSASKKEKEAMIRYFSPLKERVAEYRGHLLNHYVTIDWDFVNQILLNKNDLVLRNQDIKLLDNYRTAVIESNACSRKIIEQLAADFKKNQYLAQYNPHPNYKNPPNEVGLVIYLSEVFMLNHRKAFQPGQNICISGQYRQSSSTRTVDFLRFRSPNDEKELKRFNDEFNSVLENTLNQDAFKECVGKRAMLNQRIEELLSFLKQKI